MQKLVAIACLCSILMTSTAFGAKKPTTTKPVTGKNIAGFNDVIDTDWFAPSVKYVTDNKLMNGISENQFGPQLTTTRGMIVTILHRLEGSPEATGSTFEDVLPDKYFAEPVEWASANGIVSGYGDNRFGPNDDITREQLSAILYRYAQYKKYRVDKTADLTVFADVSKISSYAENAMRWANANNLITGITDKQLSPEGNATRAQVATILMRFDDTIAK